MTDETKETTLKIVTIWASGNAISATTSDGEPVTVAEILEWLDAARRMATLPGITQVFTTNLHPAYVGTLIDPPGLGAD